MEKKMQDKVNAIKSQLDARLQSEYTAKGLKYEDRDARNLGIAKGMVLHPQYVDVNSIKVNTIPDAQTGENRAFAFLETDEGPRLSTTQLTRRGSGIQLEGSTEGERMAHFCAILEAAKANKKTVALTVTQLYERVGNNGTMQRSAVFALTQV